jgi:hypothetical protein
MINRCILFIGITFLFILSACGGGGGNDAPFNATITVDPTSISVSFLDTDPLSCTNVSSIMIVVKNDKGIPLRDVDLDIFYPFATPAPGAVVQLYDGDPGHGAAAKDSPLSVTTDENGAYTLFFEYCGGAGIEYKEDFRISSGSLSEAVTFEVTADTGD